MKDNLTCLELGEFTWTNKNQPAIQKGWALSQEIREMFANGEIESLTIVLDASLLQASGGLGGIEINLNSEDTGFQFDWRSFPWYWDRETGVGGWINYEDLVEKKFVELEDEKLYLKYYPMTHPSYNAFKTAMSSAEWGELSIQYGIGIKYLPIINVYLHK